MKIVPSKTRKSSETTNPSKKIKRDISKKSAESTPTKTQKSSTDKLSSRSSSKPKQTPIHQISTNSQELHFNQPQVVNNYNFHFPQGTTAADMLMVIAQINQTKK